MEKNFRNLKKREAGFTFVEILTAVSIFILLLGILIGFTIWMYRANIKIQSVSETTNTGQEAMEIMLREIKRSKSIYSPVSGASQLSLGTVNYVPLGEISSFVDFFVCGTQVCMKKESESPLAITSSKTAVKNLEFAYLSPVGKPPIVQIWLRLDYLNSSGSSDYQASFNATSSASLRSFY